MNMQLPAHIKVDSAKLPQTYILAKEAIEHCINVDECKDWANRAEALASYAKQSEDDSLRKMADRIQARATRRVGELLKEFDARGGDRGKSGGAPTFEKMTRREAAAQAGLSKDQQVTAVRVANVPEDQFEAAVESDNPPTVTKLAEAGKKTAAPRKSAKPGREGKSKRKAAESITADQILGLFDRAPPDEQQLVVDGLLARGLILGRAA